MSSHGLLNLLNELRKTNKMRGLLRKKSLFHNSFNKFNYTCRSTNISFQS